MAVRRVRALGVPLRGPGKFRNRIRIGVITHAYNNRDNVKAQTLCRINYTHKEYRATDGIMLATRTSKDVDCMTCLVRR